VCPPSTRLSYSSLFCKLNNQDKATFPFLQVISFLPRSFCSASRMPCLFAGTKDAIPLRCSCVPLCQEADERSSLFIFMLPFFRVTHSLCRSSASLPNGGHLISVPFKLTKIKSTLLTRKAVQGYILTRTLMAKAGPGQGAARGGQLVSHSFFTTSARIQLCICHA